MSVIPDLNTNLFSVIRALQKVFKVKSEGQILILERNPNNICFDEKMANNGGKLFLLSTKFYKNANDTALLDSKKKNPEGGVALHLEWKVIKKHNNTEDSLSSTQSLTIP